MKDKINNFFSKYVSKNSDAIPRHYTNEGTSGTEIYSGNFNEEYLNEFLNMPEGMDTYDKMRRSDDQITMLRNSVRNPIISASWFVEPVDETPLEMEKKDFVEFLLFKDMGYPDGSKHKTWQDFIEEALSYLDFGFCAHEIVHKVVTNHPVWGNYIGIKDLGYRSQKTIYGWNLLPNGGIESLWQQVDGDLSVDVNISGKNLLILTNNKEGDNYEGISMLRPIYGSYYRKNIYYRLQAIGIERGITGTPVGTMPKDKVNNINQQNKFISMMQKYTQHQSDYILKPEGFELEVFNLNYDPSKLDAVIESENKRMAKAFLANFMELGMSTSGGSFALGTDLSDIFLNGIQLYAQKIADQVNNRVIETLVKAKYGVSAQYPTLKVSGINDKAGKEKAEIVTMLVKAGIIRPSDQLEDAMDRDYNLPIISQKQKEQDKIAKEIAEKKAVKEAKEQKANLSEIKLAERKENPTVYIKERSKVTLKIMHDDMLDRTNKYLTNANKTLKATKKSGRRNALAKLTIPDKGAYKNDLSLTLAETASQATTDVIKELGMDNVKLSELTELLDTLSPESRSKLKTEVGAIVKAQDDEMLKRMFFIASQKIDTTDSVDLLIADMTNARDSYLNSGAFSVGATNAVSGTVNTARNSVFQTPLVFEQIESFVIVNPSPQAAICVELAGRVFSKSEYLTQDLPPYHHNCETTVAAQLKGQKNIRPISPIGLAPTGTESQVAAIVKSKTF